MTRTLMCMATLKKKILPSKVSMEEMWKTFTIQSELKTNCNRNRMTKQIYAGMHPFNLPTSDVLDTVSLVIKMKEA